MTLQRRHNVIAIVVVPGGDAEALTTPREWNALAFAFALWLVVIVAIVVVIGGDTEELTVKQDWNGHLAFAFAFALWLVVAFAFAIAAARKR